MISPTQHPQTRPLLTPRQPAPTLVETKPLRPDQLEKLKKIEANQAKIDALRSKLFELLKGLAPTQKKYGDYLMMAQLMPDRFPSAQLVMARIEALSGFTDKISGKLALLFAFSSDMSDNMMAVYHDKPMMFDPVK